MKGLQFVTRLLFLLAIVAVGYLATPHSSSAGVGELYLVRYEDGAKTAVLQEIAANAGTVRHEFDHIGVLAVTLSSAAADDLAAFSGVTAVDVDPLYFPSGQTTPYGIDMVQARDVWDANRDGQIDPGAPTGAGIRVCVVDTGIWLTHEDLGGGGVNIIAGRSWVDEDWAADRQGHGTHVAGTVAAMNNDVGVVGVSPGAVDLIIADVFNDNGDGQASSTILAAANWCAEQGAHIISMSLGGPLGGLDDGYQALYDQGILIVAAAGNNGAPVQSYPASYPSVVSVAAVDYTGTVADFSNFPLTNDVELAAPGVAVLSAYPVENSVAVAGGPTYVANPVDGADPAGTLGGPTADGGDCNLPPVPGEFSGKVVLCERGGLAFRVKIDNAVAGGAIGVILYNDEPGNFSGTYGPVCCSPVPAVSLSQADGQDLRDNWLGLPVTITIDLESNSGYTELSGTSMATPHASGAAAVLWSACPSLTNDQIRSHLATFTMEPEADLIPGRDPFYGFGIVQLKDAVDALFDGIDDYDPASPNHDGRNPANVECATPPPPPPSGGAAQGSGWLTTKEGKKLNFNFSAAVEDGVAEGQLRLRDDADGVRIVANSVTAVNPVSEPCGDISAGANALEFHSAGTFNGSAATFRTCVEDNGQPGNDPQNPDRFYLECLSGCSYYTAERTPHNGLGGGNIQVREAAGGSSDGGAQSEATFLTLAPFFLAEALAGDTLNLAVTAYDTEGEPLADAPVTLTQTLADGTVITLSGVTGIDGMALFAVTAVLGSSEYAAIIGDLGSNTILVKGLLSSLP
jgi:serine protease